MALRLIEDAKREMPDLELKEVDITQHPAVAVRYGARSALAIVINRRVEFRGAPQGDALLERLRSGRV